MLVGLYNSEREMEGDKIELYARRIQKLEDN